MGGSAVSDARIEVMRFKDGAIWIAYHCPACGADHSIPVKGSKMENGAGWQWDGNAVQPTINPSINVHPTEAKNRCHHFVTGGVISFCSDSANMAGQSAPLEPWEKANA